MGGLGRAQQRPPSPHPPPPSCTPPPAENGPYTIQPNLTLSKNPHTWATLGHTIYIDQPVGTGLSFNPVRGLARACMWCPFPPPPRTRPPPPTLTTY